jgi:hypothetical protein
MTPLWRAVSWLAAAATSAVASWLALEVRDVVGHDDTVPEQLLLPLPGGLRPQRLFLGPVLG